MGNRTCSFHLRLFWVLDRVNLVHLPVCFPHHPPWFTRTRSRTRGGRSQYGTHPTPNFFEVMLPQLRPSITAGVILVALYTLSDFGAVSLLQFNSFTRAIYIQYAASFDRNLAALLSLFLVTLTILLLVLEWKFRSKAKYYRASSGAIRQAELRRLGARKVPALLLCSVLTFIGLVIPLGVILTWLIRGIRHGEQVFLTTEPLLNSLLVSAGAAIATVLAALPLAWLAVRYASRKNELLERCAYIGNALPGIVIALSIVFMGTRLTPFLYQTFPLLIFAYVIRFLPHGLSNVKVSLLQLSPRLEEAGRSLGQSPFRTWRSITLPLLKPGILTGAALVFLNTMKELPATLLLSPTGFSTLAVRIWSATEEAFFTQAAAPALVLVLASAISIWIIFHQEDKARYNA